MPPALRAGPGTTANMYATHMVSDACRRAQRTAHLVLSTCAVSSLSDSMPSSDHERLQTTNSPPPGLRLPRDQRRQGPRRTVEARGTVRARGEHFLSTAVDDNQRSHAERVYAPQTTPSHAARTSATTPPRRGARLYLRRIMITPTVRAPTATATAAPIIIFVCMSAAFLAAQVSGEQPHVPVPQPHAPFLHEQLGPQGHDISAAQRGERQGRERRTRAELARERLGAQRAAAGRASMDRCYD